MMTGESPQKQAFILNFEEDVQKTHKNRAQVGRLDFSGNLFKILAHFRWIGDAERNTEMLTVIWLNQKCPNLTFLIAKSVALAR